MAGPSICKLLLRRIGAVEYEAAGYLNTLRVPRAGEPFDVRGEGLEIINARVVHVTAPPPGQTECTIALDEIKE